MHQMGQLGGCAADLHPVSFGGQPPLDSDVCVCSSIKLKRIQPHRLPLKLAGIPRV